MMMKLDLLAQIVRIAFSFRYMIQDQLIGDKGKTITRFLINVNDDLYFIS